MQRCDVLFLIRSMGCGGAERQLSLLARSLQAHGLKVAVAVFYVGGPLEQELHDAGVEVVDLRKTGRWSNLDVLRRLRRFVHQRKPRVLHSYMPTQNVMALVLRPWLTRRGCAVACGIRTALPNAWRYNKLGGVVGLFQMMLMPQADRVISNSSGGLIGLGKSVVAGHGFVIPNGVEYERFFYCGEARDRQRSTWRLEKKAVAIGLVGRLDPQKNHRLLVDALTLIQIEQREAVLVFVGDGPVAYREEVQEHAKNLGVASRVQWAGSSDDLVAVYSALDVLCLCSVVEGFPNVVAEAMCVGLPCVATEVGDVAELMGDCGWIVPAGDAVALGQGLLQACHALPSWDRERPRRRIIEQFSVDKLTNRTLGALAPYLGGLVQ